MDEATAAATKKLEDDNKALLARLDTERARNVALAEGVVDELISEQLVKSARLDVIKSGELRTFLLAAFARDCEADAKPIPIVGADGKTTETSFFDLTKKVLLSFPGKLTHAEMTETATGGNDIEGSEGDLPPNVERYNFGAHGGRKFATSEFHERVLAHMAAEEKAGRKVSYRQAYETVSRNTSRKSG